MYGFYNSLSIEGLFDFDAYSYVSVGVKQTLLAKRATLSLSVVDLFYQITFSGIHCHPARGLRQLLIQRHTLSAHGFHLQLRSDRL